MKNKYPTDLFFMGVLMNMTGRYFFLFVPAAILLIIGIWVKICLLLGLALFALDFLLSLGAQLQIRKTTLSSDNPSFVPFQEAILSDNWREKVIEAVESKTDKDDESDD